MNLFERAIEKGELKSFAKGENNYFIRDREYDEHSALLSWINFILPFCDQNFGECRVGINNLFMQISTSKFIQTQSNLEILLYHLYVFHYLQSEGRLTGLSNILDKWDSEIAKLLKENLSKDNIGNVATSIQMIKRKGGLTLL